MIQTVLIVDDNSLDLDNLSMLFKEELNIPVVLTAKDPAEMIPLIRKNKIDLICLDISFGGDEDIDTQGLNSIHQIIEADSNIPIAIVTGYHREMIDELSKKLETGHIIDYLDKMRYDTESLRSLAEKAVQFQNRAKNQAVSVAKAKLIHKAFHGTNWEERIIAESGIEELKGNCNINGIQIWIEIEKLIRKLFQGTPVDDNAITHKIKWMVNEYKFSFHERELLFNSRDIRNQFIHAGKNINVAKARLLLKCLNFLKAIAKDE